MKTRKRASPSRFSRGKRVSARNARHHGRASDVKRKIAPADEKTSDAHGHAHLPDEQNPVKTERRV